MVSFLASKPLKQPQETARSLLPDIRQLIVELPTMSLREIAEICEARFQRCPSHNSVKMVLASGPPSSINTRRYQTWDKIPDPAERRHAVIQIHAEGWSITSIAEYLGTSRQTVYTTLKIWVKEGVKGLDDKSHARKALRVVTMEIANEIRKKQENPLIGEWRMHVALLQEGIKVSPPTCGRVMAKRHTLYGLNKPKAPPKPKKEMPFKASRRYEYWSIDIWYIEHHHLPNIKGPIYVISILENFSRMLLASAISERQDTAAYLWVLAKALRNYGAPEAIVTDSGGVFYSKRAMVIYEALDIRKEKIDSGIMRRLADYYLIQSSYAGRDEEGSSQIHTGLQYSNSFCTSCWRVLFLHRRWLASSLQRSLPTTWIDEGIFASAGGTSTLRRGLLDNKFRSAFTLVRSRSNTRTRSWPSTRLSGQRTTNTSER